MRRNFLLIGFLALVIGGVSLSAIFSGIFSSQKILSVKEIPFDVQISKELAGFNLDKDKLHFGTLFFGVSSERTMSVSYNYSKRVNVQIAVLGNISNWIHVSPSTFFLFPNETKSVVLSLSVPDKTPQGTYEGNISLLFSE